MRFPHSGLLFMKRSPTIGHRLAPLILAGALIASPAVAADFNVEISQSRLQTLSRPAATLIVGNPAIADVTIVDSNTIAVLGRSFGQTNLVALDAAGQQIANYDVHVVETQSAALTVNRGVGQYSYDCSPRCVRVINPADAQEPTSLYTGLTQSFTNLATEALGK